MIEEYYDFFDIDEYRYIYSVATSNNWQFGHFSNRFDPVEAKKKFWTMELDSDSMFTGPLFDKIKKVTNRDYLLKRVYANGQTFGLDGSWHRDIITDDLDMHETSFTFLYYINPEWDTIWGGETVFAMEDQKLVSYLPTPNKAILFPAKLFHYAKSPSRDFYDLRMTLVYKLKVI